MFSDMMNFLVIFFIMVSGYTVTMHALFVHIDGYYTMGESFLTLFSAGQQALTSEVIHRASNSSR
jgi:hypothetical protein